MAFVPVANAVLAEIRYTFDGQEVENTLWFWSGQAPTIEQLQLLGSDLLAWWAQWMRPLLSDQLVLREAYLTDQSSANGFSATVTPSGFVTGEKPQPAMPANVSLAVSFRTNQRGRSFRGRNYVIGLCEDQVVLNNIVPTVANEFGGAYQQLFGVANDNGYIWVVCSRFANGAAREIGVVTPVSAVIVADGTIDSQRRRLPGRGR